MKKSLLPIALMALVCQANADVKPGATLLDGVAAYVNEHVITISEVMQAVYDTVPPDLPESERRAQIHELYKATLDAMINRKLIVDAAKAAGAAVASWAVDQRIQEVVNRQFGGDRAKLTTVLAQQRITMDEWRKVIEEDLVIQLMRYNQVEKNVNITGQAIRQFYKEHEAEIVKKTGVGVSVIVIQSLGDATAAARGAMAIKELQEGKTFAEVAKAYSSDNKAQSGGDWGLIDPEEKFRPELVAAVAKLQPGEHSPLLLLEDHGYIVRKNSEATTEHLTLEQAWTMIETRLRIGEAEKKYIDWLNRLRRKAYIKIFELPGT